MSAFLDAIQSRTLICDGATGSLIFRKTGRLSEQNHVYESFNADQPDLLRDVHCAYVEAGVDCLTTNTFGANPRVLRRYGLEHRTAEFNTTGVILAREAFARYDRRGFVLGSIGPTPSSACTSSRLKRIYHTQATTLADAGVDAFLLETFANLDILSGVIEVLQGVSTEIPIIAQVTLRIPHGHAEGHIKAKALLDKIASSGVAVVGVNCCSPSEVEGFVIELAAERDRRKLDLSLSAMPNIGTLQGEGNRLVNRSNPEYMGRQARTLCDLGVSLIGGCCEVHPEHIREVRNYVQSRQPGGREAYQAVVFTGGHKPAGPTRKQENGPFSRKLFNNEFVVSVELLPPRGTAPKTVDSKIAFVSEMAESGLADAIDITDGSRGIPLMPPGDFAMLCRQGMADPSALEIIPHFTSRDLNTLGIQSRLIGYHWNHLRNVLFITGDPPKMAPDYPASTGVFDLDSVELARMTHLGLNAGLDFGGRPLSKQSLPCQFTIGSGFEPEAVDLDAEVQKLERKIDAGVDYFMTQPAFHREPLDVLTPYRDRTKVLVGVMVLSSLAQAQRIAAVPGVVLPRHILDTLAQYDSAEDQAKAGMDLAVAQAAWVRSNGWDGLYIMAPGSHKKILDILRSSQS